MDDMLKEKQALREELGIDEDNLGSEDDHAIAAKVAELNRKMKEEY